VLHQGVWYESRLALHAGESRGNHDRITLL